MGSALNPAGDSDQVVEQPDVQAAGSASADDGGGETNPAVVDLTDPTQAPRRFYANLADL